MTAMANVAPTIIRRKKIVGGGSHHGGAWKVAYADFVTAMMAFFMLMWLLNATTEKQRKGIADYFSPTIPINRISGGGSGSFGGNSVFSEMVLPQNGTGATSSRPTESDQARGARYGSSEMESKADNHAFELLENTLAGMSGESLELDEMLRHVESRITDEGLVIELFDLDNSPLFTDTDEPTALLRGLAEVLVRLSGLIENPVAIEGHLRSGAIVLAHNRNWQRSVDRANLLRHLMQDDGFEEQRINRVTGHADRELIVANPMAVRNNRLEMIFLRQ